MKPLPTSPPYHPTPSPFDDPANCHPRVPLVSQLPHFFIPPDQRYPVAIQRVIARATLSLILRRCGYPSSRRCDVWVAPIGMWTAPDMLGFVNYGEPKRELYLTMIAAGVHGAPDRPPIHVGLDPITWAQVLIHESAHVLELHRAVTSQNGCEILRRFPDEKRRPSFRKACDYISRKLFGEPLTVGIDIAHWPQGQHGAEAQVNTIADAVMPYLAPPTRWIRKPDGEWAMDMRLPDGRMTIFPMQDNLIEEVA